MPRLTVLLLTLALTPCLAAQAPPSAALPERLFEQQITLSPLGDASVRLRWSLPARDYAELLARLGPATKTRDKDGKEVVVRRRPAPESVLHYLNLANLDLTLDGAKVTLDDDQKAITATFRVRGWARTVTAGAWFVEVLDNARWYAPTEEFRAPVAGSLPFAVEKSPPGILRFAARQQTDDAVHLVRAEVKLPAGANRPRLHKRGNGRWAVTYDLARKPSGGSASASLAFAVDARREVMPALHKLYGDPAWVTYALARTTFTNPTAAPVRNLRVRARVSTSAGQTAWGEWEAIAAVVHPGQSVQYPLYPVLDSAPLMVATREAAKLSVELQFTRDGKTSRVTRTARLELLGRNDAAFTHLDLSALGDPTLYHAAQEAPVVLTAFVTPHDPVVKDLKARLSQHVGGLATATDAGAVRFARAIHDFFRCNLTYSSPATVLGTDGRLVQHVNYARNVLKDGTGTCIDLAVTYASIAEAAGLIAGVVLIPNHVFAVVVLPQSGLLLAVETTCCGRGTLEGSAPFAVALEKGQQHMQSGQPRVLTTLRSLRRHVGSPELPALDAPNLLAAWGRTLPPPRPQAELGEVQLRHNVLHKGRLGMRFTVPVKVTGAHGQTAELTLALVQPDGRPFLNSAGRPIHARFAMRPGKDGTWDSKVDVNYPYGCVKAEPDNVWREVGLRVDVWSPTYRENVALDAVADRLLLQRSPAEDEGHPAARSLIVQTVVGRDRGGKPGVELRIRSVQLDRPAAKGARTVVAVVGGPYGELLRKGDGTTVQHEREGVGQASLWFAEEELLAAGSAKVKELGLVVNFWDAGQREWLLPRGATVALRR